ncbi:hypothetical protein LTR95_012325, partial [Oleoguttula sp. CCFEE 5521]
IQKITGIPSAVLRKEKSHMCWTVAQRMSWAAGRRTKRVEDRAYSLLGLFQLNMTLLYGEGISAFQRLQLELLQRYPDESVFAWASQSGQSNHVLAGSPDDFKNSGLLEPPDAQHRVKIDPDLRRVNPPRVTSWGIELKVNARKLVPRRPIVFNGRTQRFLLAFPLTVAWNESIQELPCTIVLVRSGPAPYSYQRFDCLFGDADERIRYLSRYYDVEECASETLVYLQFDAKTHF